jgi:hypothetical protein
MKVKHGILLLWLPLILVVCFAVLGKLLLDLIGRPFYGYEFLVAPFWIAAYFPIPFIIWFFIALIGSVLLPWSAKRESKIARKAINPVERTESQPSDPLGEDRRY